MHLGLEHNTPALVPSVKMRSATSGQPSPPVGRPINLAKHTSTSPAPSLIGAVGGINEIVTSASNSNQIWKRYIMFHAHHHHKANFHVHSYGCTLSIRSIWQSLSHVQYQVLFQAGLQLAPCYWKLTAVLNGYNCVNKIALETYMLHHVVHYL